MATVVLPFLMVTATFLPAWLGATVPEMVRLPPSFSLPVAVPLETETLTFTRLTALVAGRAPPSPANRTR